MKRLICALLLISLMIPACAFSDVADMPDEELIALYESARDEMVARGLFKEATLPAGAYYAGSYLPEGVYECTNTRGGGAAYTYKNYESYLAGEDYLSRVWLVADQSFTMILQGETCYVLEFNSIIRPAGLQW